MRGFVKTRIGVAVLAVLFLILLLTSELSPLNDLLAKNEITASGVAKYRIHILATPGLEKLENKLSNMNSTVILEQLPASNYFRADGGHGFHDYFLLTDKWDFKNLEPTTKNNKQKPANANIEQNSPEVPDLPEDLSPDYRLELEEDAVFLMKNDQSYFQLPLDKSLVGPVSLFNKRNSAAINPAESGTTKIYLIPDLGKPEFKTIDCKQQIVDTAIDPFGSRIYVLIKKIESKDDNSTRRSILMVDLKEPERINSTATPVSFHSKIFFNQAAEALLILDQEKLRIIDATTGSVRSIYNFKKEEHLSEKDIVVLPGVPGALIKEDLIDLRSADKIDTLIGFSPASRYIIDYKNKRLYYSSKDDSVEVPACRFMNIASYDLHNLSLEQQITLKGKRASEQQSGSQRKDSIEKLFLDKDGNLVVLSAPR